MLRKFPLDKQTMQSGDAGKPIVLAHPDTTQAKLYKDLAQDVIQFLAKQRVN